MHIISKTYQLFFLILGILFFNIAHAQYRIPPKPKNKNQKFVYDYARLLTARDNNFLETKLTRYADSTSTQVVIVIIESLKGESIGMLAPKWGHKWGIGQEEEDNGVILLLAKRERKIWISPGYGAENELTAGVTGQIVRNRIIPYFKRGDYAGGLNTGIDSIIEVLSGEFENTRKNARHNYNDESIPAGAVIFLIIFLIIFIIVLSNNKRNGGNNSGGHGMTGGDLFDIIILSNMGRGGFGSGSSSGGGFSGGGGFGGGGFSGGGAGGSW